MGVIYHNNIPYGGGGDASWGNIDGTLSDQTDLQTVLDTKPDAIRISKDEYDALTEAQKHDTTKAYYIYDYDTLPTGAIDDNITALDSTWSSKKIGGLFNLKVDKISGKQLSDNNYSNADKAIVDGVNSALSNKVDKISGKGLSTNDYDATAKQTVDSIPLTIEQLQGSLLNKVDKVNGKGLSTEDYTTAEKTKLNSINLDNYGEIIRLTASQYNALTDEQKHDTTKLYLIYDTDYME